MNYISHKLIFVFMLYSWLLSGQCVTNTTISTDRGASTIIYTCPRDGRNDLITFTSDANEGDYLFIITNQNDIIVDYRTTPYVNFENARPGVFKVWGLSYTGSPDVRRGRKLFASTLSDDCFAISSNAIEIRMEVPSAGTIRAAEGAETISVCPNSGNLELVGFVNDRPNAPNYAYLLVDQVNRVIDYSIDGSIGFADVAEGTYSVQGIAYRGNLVDNLIGRNINKDYLSDDCFSLSNNRVVVNIETPIGGTITSSVGTEQINLCDDSNTIIFDNDAQTVLDYVYLVLDENAQIVSILNGATALPPNTLPAGQLSVRGMAYSGQLRVQVGDILSDQPLSSNCFSLSENTIPLEKPNFEIGTFSTTDDELQVQICPSSTIEVKSALETDLNQVFVVVNDVGEVVQLSAQAEFAIETEGNLQVWAATYTGTLNIEVGDILSSTAISDQCYRLSSNAIFVEQAALNGGALAFQAGEEEIAACPEMFGNLLLDVNTNGASAYQYSYLLLNEQNEIVRITDRTNFMFTEDQTGTFQIIGVAHLSDLTVEVGMVFTEEMTLTNDCYALSENALSVYWTSPTVEGVSTTSGETVAYTCADEENSSLSFTYQQATTRNVEFVLVNDAGTILEVTRTSFDFGQLEAGTYEVYGIAYASSLRNVVGQTLEEAIFSNDCYSLSESPITVYRATPMESIVATDIFETNLSVCTRPNTSATITVSNNSDGTTAYSYILTNEQNVVLAIFEDTLVSLDANAITDRRIWGISHTTPLTIQPNETLVQTEVEQGCALLSSNFITVDVQLIQSTRIASFSDPDQVSICYGDGQSDNIGFYPESNISGNFKYVITDENNVMLGAMIGNIQNFEMPGPVISRVWGVNYTGAFRFQAGQKIEEATLATGCFALSENFVTIVRAQLDAGTISLEGNQNDVTLCATLGQSQVYELFNTSNSTNSYTYLVLDDVDNVLDILTTNQIDVGQYSQNYLRVMGIAHTNPLTISVGENLGTTTLSEGCYDFSLNEVALERTVVTGGTITTAQGTSEAFLCPTDAAADMVFFDNQSATTATYQFIITDENEQIVAITTDDFFDFTALGEGNYIVWGVNYLGDFTAQVGEFLTTDLDLATGCFGLSDTFITVSYAAPVVDKVTTGDGAGTFIAFIGDGEADVTDFALPESNGNQQIFVITNTQGMIIDWTTTNTYDFNNFSVGFFRVYGAIYTGAISLEKGIPFNPSQIADGCVSVSANYVQIICAPGNRGQLAQNTTAESASLLTITKNELVLQPMTPAVQDIKIFNAMGQLVQRKPFLQDRTIDITGLSAGWYLVVMQAENSTYQYPFVKP